MENKQKAELKTILAQYYVEQENLEDAIDHLSESLPSLSKRSIKKGDTFYSDNFMSEKEITEKLIMLTEMLKIFTLIMIFSI